MAMAIDATEEVIALTSDQAFAGYGADAASMAGNADGVTNAEVKKVAEQLEKTAQRKAAQEEKKREKDEKKGTKAGEPGKAADGCCRKIQLTRFTMYMSSTTKRHALHHVHVYNSFYICAYTYVCACTVAKFSMNHQMLGCAYGCECLIFND